MMSLTIFSIDYLFVSYEKQKINNKVLSKKQIQGKYFYFVLQIILY